MMTTDPVGPTDVPSTTEQVRVLRTLAETGPRSPGGPRRGRSRRTPSASIVPGRSRGRVGRAVDRRRDLGGRRRRAPLDQGRRRRRHVDHVAEGGDHHCAGVQRHSARAGGAGDVDSRRRTGATRGPDHRGPGRTCRAGPGGTDDDQHPSEQRSRGEPAAEGDTECGDPDASTRAARRPCASTGTIPTWPTRPACGTPSSGVIRCWAWRSTTRPGPPATVRAPPVRVRHAQVPLQHRGSLQRHGHRHRRATGPGRSANPRRSPVRSRSSSRRGSASSWPTRRSRAMPPMMRPPSWGPSSCRPASRPWARTGPVPSGPVPRRPC